MAAANLCPAGWFLVAGELVLQLMALECHPSPAYSSDIHLAWLHFQTSRIHHSKTWILAVHCRHHIDWSQSQDLNWFWTQKSIFNMFRNQRNLTAINVQENWPITKLRCKHNTCNNYTVYASEFNKKRRSVWITRSIKIKVTTRHSSGKLVFLQFVWGKI